MEVSFSKFSDSRKNLDRAGGNNGFFAKLRKTMFGV